MTKKEVMKKYANDIPVNKDGKPNKNKLAWFVRYESVLAEATKKARK